MNIKGIYSKHCWLDGRLQEATIYFADGIITSIIKGAPQHFDGIENRADNVVMPGIIDAHVHANEPGRTDWEGFDTATQAAAAGGITTIVDMPLNASPVTTTTAAFEEKLNSAQGKLHVNCGFYGGLVPGNFNELQDLIDSGVLGIKAFLTHSGIDEFPNVTEADLDRDMPLITKNNLPLLVHCELSDDRHDEELTKDPTNYKAYLKSRPKAWENDAVKMMIALCRKHHGPVHIVHVSSSEALSIIADAKAEGLPVTAETCPQYILFNAEQINDGQTIFKCAPPIRERANNALLIGALKTGVLDFIASDHSPAPPSIKELESGNFKKAWGGISGLQFLLPASWTALKNSMSLDNFIPLLTEHPARFLKLDEKKGYFKEGYDADIVVWSPEESFTVEEDAIFHRHKISPYVDKQLSGVVHQSYVGGQLVFNNGQIVQKNNGKWLLRK